LGGRTAPAAAERGRRRGAGEQDGAHGLGGGQRQENYQRMAAAA
jgi:hypothetical protein